MWFPWLQPLVLVDGDGELGYLITISESREGKLTIETASTNSDLNSMEDRTALADVCRTRKISYKESQQPKSPSAGEEENAQVRRAMVPGTSNMNLMEFPLKESQGEGRQSAFS